MKPLCLSIFLVIALAGCKPHVVGEQLLEDEILTKTDSISILSMTDKWHDNEYLYQVPTTSLNKPIFSDVKQQPIDVPSSQFMIDQVRVHLPGAISLDDADIFGIVGKKSRASIFVLRPKKGEWSYVLKQDI